MSGGRNPRHQGERQACACASVQWLAGQARPAQAHGRECACASVSRRPALAGSGRHGPAAGWRARKYKVAACCTILYLQSFRSRNLTPAAHPLVPFYPAGSIERAGIWRRVRACVVRPAGAMRRRGCKGRCAAHGVSRRPEPVEWRRRSGGWAGAADAGISSTKAAASTTIFETVNLNT
jgi:hypothetical protein